MNIVFGSDVGAFEHGTSAREFKIMVDYGMKPMDAIKSATIRAAELMRRENEIGTIEKGKYADIVAVSGDPLADIQILEDVAFVMKGGQIIKNRTMTNLTNSK